RCTTAVTGVGDCGGCTAGSVADAVRAAEDGLDAFVVVSAPFENLARAVLAEHSCRPSRSWPSTIRSGRSPTTGLRQRPRRSRGTSSLLRHEDVSQGQLQDGGSN